ncbi:MAG: DNA/RNA non-specific endonuclease, partial [Ginsengibacter sp.]
WGELEDAIRGYMYRNPTTQLFVVTGPILNDNLSKIERGVNKVSIPKYFWKIALDLKNQKAIGFIMPNEEITKPLQSYAVPISEVEQRTGLQFFTKLPPEERQNITQQKNIRDWLPEKNFADAEVMDQESLPRNLFNTEVAKSYMDFNGEISVVGTVVGARVSKAGNILLNLDRQFPKQIFTVFIKKENILNFSYSPDKELMGKVIVVKGRVVGLGGVPAMFIENEKALSLYPKTK